MDNGKLHLDTIIFICPKKDFGYFKKEIGGGFWVIRYNPYASGIRLAENSTRRDSLYSGGQATSDRKRWKNGGPAFVYDAIFPCIILLENISIMEKKG